MRQFILFLLAAGLFSACQPNTSTDTEKAAATVSKTPVAKTVALKNGVQIGEKAPAFNLKGIDGHTYSFDNIMDANGNKPKGFIVIFTCNTCPVAKANEERIIALHNTFSPKGYPVVAIQPNDPALKPGDSYSAMQSYASEKGFPFLYLFDDGQEIYPQYGATRTPEVFLVDTKRIVRYHGAIDNSARDADSVSEKFLEKAIDAVETGQEPSPAKTKAIGCSIKAA